MRYAFLLLALACDSNVKIVPVDVVEDVVTDLDGDGYSETEGDCDDSDGSVNIGAAEICDGIDNNCDGAVDEGVKIPFYADSDGDGFGNAQYIEEACDSPEGYVPNGNDCDDTRIDIYPSADEICDGIDNDCNDLVDDGLGLVMYQDADFDGFGDPELVVEGCQDEPGLSGIAGDCDDSNPALNPDAAEACDELDNNCDGAVDEGVQETYYLDADADGFGDLNVIEDACSRPAGYSENSDDCDDGDTAISPSASEVCDGIDNNCDFLIDDSSSVNQSTYYSDTDGDGFGDASSSVESCTLAAGFSANDEDCDDSDSSVNPDASEVCDGIDNDCDLAIDDADPSASGASTWYLDADVDGFGNSSFTTDACVQPSGFVADSSDCNDIDATVNPNASEVCDEIDNDCDGDIDDDDATLDQSTRVLSYSDSDGDGYGDVSSSVESCTLAAGFSANDEDCDDSDSSVNPDASEICDGFDNDCDGDIDDGDSLVSGALTWYLDADVDGFGNSSFTMEACLQPSGFVADSTDCNDIDATVNPNVSEVCDEIDNDCDGDIDDDDATLDQSTRVLSYSDSDGDGYGDVSSSVESCTLAVGFSANDQDCDDSDSNVNPDASEICDGIDNDCDLVIDDADPSVSGVPTWYLDADVDGFGSGSFTTDACVQPSGFVADSSDCNDIDAAVNPNASEVCDEIDNNCNGDIDDDDSSVDLNTGSTFYEDADEDGFGDLSAVVVSCTPPLGYITDASDCDDGDATVNPSATEICDGLDDNCSGVADDDSALYGLFYSCPAYSCDDILTDNPMYTDGVYWIDPDGGGAVGAYCNMGLADGGWTLVGKFSNQDSRSWANSASNWSGYNNFGNTTNLTDGSDAKSELWYRMVVDEFLLNDHLNQTDYIHTDDSCIGGNSLADYFTQALASFPYSSQNYFDACTVQFTYHPNWGLEPNWNNQISTSSNLGLNASGRIAIAKTDSNSDTSGVISFYEADDGMEADLGLGALEDGTNFTNTGNSQDVGGPTSCGYNDSTCAIDYPETVFFWVR